MKRSASLRGCSKLSVSGIFVSCVFLSMGCTWSRFSALTDEAPVERLDPPKDFEPGFGVTLAVVEGQESADVYVGTPPRSRGGLVYSLGIDERPQPNPTDRRHCPSEEGSDFCGSIVQAAGLHQSWSPQGPKDLCFVTGVGTIEGRDVGLWTRCDDSSRFIYPVPPNVRAELGRAADPDNPRLLSLATNRREAQLMLAATVAQKRAWYYPPLERDPIDLVTPSAAGDSLGEAIAVARVDGAYLLAWAAPKQGQLWLFREDGEGAVALGCIGGNEGFGRALATGDVDGDGQDDLVVAEAAHVSVFSGAVLAALPEAQTETCSLASLPEGAHLASLTCQSGPETTSCASSDFGSSLAVFDSNGDGRGELAVGARRMAVRDETLAGAVLIYDGEGQYLQTLIASDAKSRDAFGTSVAAIRQADREILVVGAPGSRRVYVHYCAGRTEGTSSERCR